MQTREYITRDVETNIVDTPAGRLTIQPLEKDRVRIESGWVQNVEGPTDGLTLHGVLYGATGFCWMDAEGNWSDRPPEGHAGDLMLSRRDRYGDGSPAAYKAARAVIEPAVAAWARTHADELAEADRIWRNNEARGAEEQIARAREYIAELEAIVEANDRGETRSQYSHSFEPLHKSR